MENSNEKRVTVVGENIVSSGAEKYSDKPVLQALLQLIPGWSSADTLLKARASEMHQERLFTFFDELENGDKELTQDLISTNEFLHAYFATVKAVWGTRRKEKIRQFARLLKSDLIREQSDENAETFEEMLKVLDELGHREFTILLLLRDYEKQYSGRHATGGELSRISLYWGDFKGDAQKILQRKTPLDAFMTRLERTGCFLHTVGSGFGKTTDIFSYLCELVHDHNEMQLRN